MESEDEIESEVSGGAYDNDIEDFEEEKDNKRPQYYAEDEEEDDEGDEFNSQKKKMKFTSPEELKRLSKPATAEELNRLRETENLFHSNLFRLQIEEVLKEVCLKKKYRDEFEKWIEKFHATLIKLEDSEQKHSLSDFSWLKSIKVKFPLPKLPDVRKGTYQFMKPLNVEVVGSYGLGTLLGPSTNVDVVVQLPHKFFKKQDYENCCYHIKKALYLCDLINHVQNLSELVANVNFISDENDILQPKIEITPSGKLGVYLTVIVSVIVDKNGVDLKKFNPNQNNVKMNWFFKKGNSVDNFNLENPTPFYNSTILADITLQDNYKFVHNLLEPHRNIKDGIILLKIWLRQHELTSSLGYFSGFLVAMLVGHLLQIRKLNTYMSSYQVVRSVLNFLVSSDWTNNGISLCKVTGDYNIPTVAEFHEHHSVVFIDTTGYFNLCYGMHSSTFLQIQHEAKIALKALDDPNINSFQVLFMTPVPFYRHFDHVIMFTNEEALENIADIHSKAEDRLNHCGVIYPLLVNIIYDVLKKGFRGRVLNLCVRQSPKIRWKPQKKFRHLLRLTFGLNLNSENYFSVVDKATVDETLEFRRFWGDRSELRRFQDGSITEAVVWDAVELSKKRLICKDIVTYLMKYKFGLDPMDFRYFADQFDHFISENIEESAMHIIDISGKLNKILRSLKDLPLDIVSVQGASPVFRYTELLPMSSAIQKKVGKHRYRINGESGSESDSYKKLNINMTQAPDFVNPVLLILHMGATNKWPQDISAIKRLRTAFYIKIASVLNKNHGIQSMVYPDRIELIYEGIVFHLKIFCPNEIGLLKQITEDGLIKYRDNAVSIAVERQMIQIPKLTSALHGLYEQHSSFGPACCIVKRWVNSQMMDPHHISEEVLDMLVAYLYISPTPNDVPHQPQAAFLRFLYMMATMDWNNEYIVLNINGELNREDLQEIDSHFSGNRDFLPALFIATPYDKTKSSWTRDCPTPLILLRLVQLCKKALSFIEDAIFNNTLQESEVNTLFEPSFDPYNAIIHLNGRFNSKAKSFDKDTEVDTDVKHVPVNGFDTVFMYVKELRDAYDDVALFFYDNYGGNTIGVVWKPRITEAKDFKVANMAMRTLDINTGKLHLVKELIIEDFLVLGKGLVKSVDLKENGNCKSFTYL